MKQFFLLLLPVILASNFLNAQSVGIGTTSPNASAMLDITSPSNNKGLLIPRMTALQRTTIASPANGLMVYETTSNSLWIYNSTSATWVQQSSGGISPWTTLNNQIYNTNTGRVGIGTSVPDTSAELEIRSTNTGLLIPRMTSTQRLAIPLPARGLLVYETTTNSFWYFNSSVWNQIGTGGASPWTTSGTNIYNSNTGNVGIGTSSPTSKLHVAGNALFNGTNPILQLQQAGVNAGYIQISGDDLRIGTNSGNSAGKMVVRMDGTDRVFIDSIGQVGIGRSTPIYDLDINGNARIHSTSTSTKSVLNMYANPYLSFDATGFGSSYISFSNWTSLGGGNYDFNSKFKIEFDGGAAERLKFQHVDYDYQLVLTKTGRVGIGEAAPAEKLQVNGNQLLEAAHPILKLKTTSLAAATAEADIEFNGPSSNLASIRYTNSSLVMTGRNGAFNDLVLNNGNVGIGIGTPTEKLQLVGGNMLMTSSNPMIQMQQGSIDKGFIQLNGDDFRIGCNSSNINGKFVVRTAAGDQFFVDNAGYVGIGVTGLGAEAKVHVGTGLGVSLTQNGYLMLGNSSGSNMVFDINEIQTRTNGAAASMILQRSGGTVRIGGTAVPSGYKFAVDGKVICEELKVKLVSSGWPDYVFGDNYTLPTLKEVEKYIQQNKHLPNIPSATEIEKNGIEVGDMQKRMMEKIEQMTLYILQLQKQIDELKNK